MTKSLFQKTKSLMFLLLILTSAVVAFSFLPHASAETQIIRLSTLVGNVGSTVLLEGNITKGNGTYQIRWDDDPTPLVSRNATGNEVNASFLVPETTVGTHNVTLIDVDARENNSRSFTVMTSYSMKADVPNRPNQLQEGDWIPININITGATGNMVYVANITVTTPNNNASYPKLLDVSISSKGSGVANVSYPNGFPAPANTNFTGAYTVLFNATQAALAVDSFFIGLTNSSEYHRGQIVDIKAVRAPNESVNVTISGNNVRNSEIVTADNLTGLVHYTNWPVPGNASIGNFTVSVTSASNVTKNPSDLQTFAVPGYSINVTTLNLAGQTVSDVNVQIIENGMNVTDGLSNSSGLVPLMLETGTFTREAYYKGVKVGEDFSLVVSGEASVDFRCNLTNLRINVTDAAENSLPHVGLALISSLDNRSLDTEINGTAVIQSLLPNIAYTLNASRYNMLFNTTTIPLLPTKDWYDLKIVCPTMTLNVNVTNVNGQPINGAIVKAQEVLGGPYYQNNSINGLAILAAPLGRYTVGVYISGARVNQTTVDLNETVVNLPINCGLYGLSVSVRVVDYFGQSILNANITWQRSGLQGSGVTGGDGKVAFDNVMGGDLQVAVQLAGQSEPCVIARAFVDENTKTIDVKIDKYVILAGMLVETSRLLTVIIVVVIVVLILSLELFRRKRLKPEKSEKVESE